MLRTVKKISIGSHANESNRAAYIEQAVVSVKDHRVVQQRHVAEDNRMRNSVGPKFQNES